MLCEKFSLSADGRVSLSAFVHRWTTVQGTYPRRGAVLVLPGGGYEFPSISEGEPVALAFAAAGFDAFVLRYSLGAQAAFPNCVAEAGQALALIRAHADEWHIDPDKLAVCGFSAGGHLAACLGTMWNRPDVTAATAVPEGANRPNALILGYPCITMDPDGDPDMFRFLAGERGAQALIETASAEKFVGPQTPPTFLWAITEDKLVPIEHSLLFLRALAEHDVPFESHLYGTGAHACALAGPETSLGAPERESARVGAWFPACRAWLTDLFGGPALGCPQTDINPPEPGRAHIGVPVKMNR